MLNIQIASVTPAFETPELLVGLTGLLSRIVTMGLLEGKPVVRLDADAVKRMLDALQAGGLLATQRPRLDRLLRKPAASADAAAALGQLIAVLEESPVPKTEWPVMREVFGDEALADLVGVSASTLRRYASAERTTPPPIAERLHWLAMVVADLAGSYNELGVQRWFERGRAQLGGKSPHRALGPHWSPGDPAAREVRALAAGLVGAGAT